MSVVFVCEATVQQPIYSNTMANEKGDCEIGSG